MAKNTKHIKGRITHGMMKRYFREYREAARDTAARDDHSGVTVREIKGLRATLAGIPGEHHIDEFDATYKAMQPWGVATSERYGMIVSAAILCDFLVEPVPDGWERVKPEKRGPTLVDWLDDMTQSEVNLLAEWIDDFYTQLHEPRVWLHTVIAAREAGWFSQAQEVAAIDPLEFGLKHERVREVRTLYEAVNAAYNEAMSLPSR